MPAFAAEFRPGGRPNCSSATQSQYQYGWAADVFDPLGAVPARSEVWRDGNQCANLIGGKLCSNGRAVRARGHIRSQPRALPKHWIAPVRLSRLRRIEAPAR
jgi:hypothetical protein